MVFNKEGFLFDCRFYELLVKREREGCYDVNEGEGEGVEGWEGGVVLGLFSFFRMIVIIWS